MATAHGKKAIIAAIIGNLLIAITKFIAAAITGSVAMLSEGIHSVVDTGNGGLLLLGMRLAKKPADKEHPFGHGKEIYFWTLVVAMSIFAVGGGISLYEGVTHIIHPKPLGDPTWNYWVLGLSIIFEAYAFTVALKEFNKVRGSKPLLGAIRSSKDPTTFTVLFEDSAAMLGLIVAAIGVFLGHQLNMPVMDGIASTVIGLILFFVATFLAVETKGLLLGESADPEIVSDVERIARTDRDVEAIHDALTMHMGPYNVLLNIGVEFKEGLTAREVEEAIDRLERRIQEDHPEIRHIYLKADSVIERE